MNGVKRHFPNESAEYRHARSALLDEEIRLREQIARVAELRSHLPSGGAVKEDYAFEEMLYADIEGQPRHMDLMWPLWNVFDTTPEGRGTDWYPSLTC